MAICGELNRRSGTKQDVETILNNVAIERSELLKHQETKKAKKAPMIEEGLFEIPESWVWVPLGELCVFLSRGKSPKYSKEELYPVFAQKCNQPDGLALEKALFLDKDTLEKWADYYRLRDCDVVINSTGTGTMGRVGYYSAESLNPAYPFMLPDSHITVVRVGNGIMPKYIYYALRSATLQTIMERQFRGTTNQKEFYIESVYAMPIPLPPYEEQQDIVRMLDAAFESINCIDKAQKQYYANLEVLRSKVVEAGIKGELTSQLSEDGNAEDLFKKIRNEKDTLIKEKKIRKSKELPAISEDEIPFDIPKNWKWVRFSDLYSLSNGIASRGSQGGTPRPVLRLADLTSGVIDTSNVREISLTDSEYETHKIQKDDLIFIRVNGSRGRVANAYLYSESDEVSYCDHLFCGHRISNSVEPAFIMMVYTSEMVKRQIDPMIKTTAGQNTISQGNMGKIVIPLPPQEEQKRIVRKVNELLTALPE